jgi:IS1 family transposase
MVQAKWTDPYGETQPPLYTPWPGLVGNLEPPVITKEQRTRIARLVLARISPRGICRVVGGGLQWLLQFMVERFQAAPDHFYVEQATSGPKVLLHRLEVEAEELWSFVEKKANRQWIWRAMDATTRQVLAFHVGDRSRQSATALWEKLPVMYQEQATCSTDQYAVDTGVLPPARHRAIAKRARTTTHVERCNGTLRQRVARRVRTTFSFSKKLSNHIGAIKDFIPHYNLTKCAALPE